jgi:hypothetical protein
VAQAIPEAIAKFIANHPGVSAGLAQHTGTSTTMPVAIHGVAP